MNANKSKRTPASSSTKKPAAIPKTPQRPLRFIESLAPGFLEKPIRRSNADGHRNKRRERSPPTPFLMDAAHLVEINLISAQALKSPPGSRRFQTYAVAWIDPAAKLRTAVDRGGGENPTWNEKFVFRVPAALLSPDSSSALSVEIYALGGWYFPDSLVGAVRLLLDNLGLLKLPPDSPSFAAVGIRRPSGRIHGILNVGAAVLSRVPVFVSEALAVTSAVGYRDFIRNGARPQLRRANSSKLISTPPSPVAADLALKECNRDIKEDESNCGGGEMALCGLGFPRKIHASPFDQNLAMWGFHEKKYLR
ncbi:uncharacterized protein LOC110112060 [Dendrobium catenatum]|uniref:C2 domain-containing protein n=1 Tax=Dendrobium catenatum TaxID=906689 RepID=A0A2I0XFD6_9ASPA|nr:uncharacterized protein LOC110112060 [Dendrobium catenatum]PKU86631.1 hypothetical protein MA16_Dca010856 [Dendrobium catenatum]